MIFDKSLFSNRRVLVTGASSGIGRVTSILLSRLGAKLVITGRSEERLAATLTMLDGDGHEAVAFDLSGEDDISDFLKTLTSDDRPFSSVFHAAGIELVRPVKLSKSKQFDEVFASSVKSALALSRAASMRGVMSDGGALVFMSSVAAQSGQAGMSVYSAAKAAIDGLVRSLAVEFAPRHIRVNSIAAGAVTTEMHERLTVGAPDDAMKAYEGRHPLGFGNPADVANVAIFMLSDAGRWITGATWVVDGGYLAR